MRKIYSKELKLTSSSQSKEHDSKHWQHYTILFFFFLENSSFSCPNRMIVLVWRVLHWDELWDTIRGGICGRCQIKPHWLTCSVLRSHYDVYNFTYSLSYTLHTSTCLKKEHVYCQHERKMTGVVLFGIGACIQVKDSGGFLSDSGWCE